MNDKVYIVFEEAKSNKYAEMVDEYDLSTAVYATTSKAKADKFIAEHKNDETFDYYGDCVRFDWEIDKDETKEQLIVDLNKVAVRMNWGTIERTINDDGTNGMPYMIDVIARTIAYLRGERR